MDCGRWNSEQWHRSTAWLGSVVSPEVRTYGLWSLEFSTVGPVHLARGQRKKNIQVARVHAAGLVGEQSSGTDLRRVACTNLGSSVRTHGLWSGGIPNIGTDLRRVAWRKRRVATGDHTLWTVVSENSEQPRQFLRRVVSKPPRSLETLYGLWSVEFQNGSTDHYGVAAENIMSPGVMLWASSR
ncbi:hypothetical protein AVEN_144816-1 [Araneus ventricosus]|uniref:Uncharacterized protein n=1 Tax=Araneus ventricosus TaxID=182803 RepID=A0A4Y2VRC4_ARAVE|nr:hypothetical protein AVEN_144816-1 [Araneus ventricosus]